MSSMTLSKARQVDRPPAVCIIVEDLPVPFDRRVWQEACALWEAGYRVSVICRKGKDYGASYERIAGIDIYRHGIWEASSPFGYLIEYSMALAAEFVLALKAYRRTRFRILHACNPPDTIFLIGLFFKLLGVRFIFDHHDLNPELFEAKFHRKGFFHRLLLLAERLTYHTATVAIVTNESYREIAITRGGKRPERVFIVRSCPDLKTYHIAAPRPELRQGKNLLVVYLGTMGPQEGVDLLIASIELIVRLKKRYDTHFALIGGGTEVPRLKEMVAERNLDSWVTFTGRIPDDELAAYLSTADVCVAPDPYNEMNDKSTMNKILQYMAFARPVVLFDLTEGRRSAGDAALYAKPNDPADLAQKLLILLDSEPLRRQMGERGRKRIEEGLNWEAEKKWLLHAYEAALKK
ncbi:MAG TPA: glycosyltransferase family 4 protein [Terriglobia bacterium]|nr:glycosyltransferase family 4 protein [Terriglobia bacterium]